MNEQAIANETDALIAAVVQGQRDKHPTFAITVPYTVRVVQKTPDPVVIKHAGNTRPLAPDEVRPPVEMKRGRRAS